EGKVTAVAIHDAYRHGHESSIKTNDVALDGFATWVDLRLSDAVVLGLGRFSFRRFGFGRFSSGLCVKAELEKKDTQKHEKRQFDAVHKDSWPGSAAFRESVVDRCLTALKGFLCVFAPLRDILPPNLVDFSQELPRTI